MNEELYYIQHVKFVGNCMLFWRPNGCGYTVDLDDAWKVSKQFALNICKSRPEEDFPRLATLVDSLAKRHVDVQHFPRNIRSAPENGAESNAQTPAGQPTQLQRERELSDQLVDALKNSQPFVYVTEHAARLDILDEIKAALSAHIAMRSDPALAAKGKTEEEKAPA